MSMWIETLGTTFATWNFWIQTVVVTEVLDQLCKDFDLDRLLHLVQI